MRAAAEALFAEHGLSGVTLRQLTRRAQVNLAAVHYHHGGLAELYREILGGGLRILNEARIGALTSAESASAGAPIPLELLVDAFAGPLLGSGEWSAALSPELRRLLGRVLLETHPLHDALIREELEPTLTRFAQAFRRHAPGMPATDFVWTFSLLVGALHHAAGSLHAIGDRTRGVCRNDDADSALRNLRLLVQHTLAPVPS